MNHTPSSACYSPRPPISSLSALLIAFLCVAGGPAAFPVSAKDLTDPANAEELKEQWSYLNVLTFGAEPTGKEDSTEAIQRALDHARDQSKGILFPLGTYLISDTLRALKIQVQGKHGYWRQTYILTGEDRGDGRRPLIKINPSSDKFDDPDKPRPMLLLALYVMGVVRSKEELHAIDPFALKDINDSVRIAGNPTAITARARQLFECSLTGIDFDCGSKAGAVGVSYDAAQKSFLANVKVNATGSHAGFWGIPGRTMGGVNIEVLGGKYGVILTATTAGATLTGLNLYDQTVSAIDNRDFCPANIVGFHIRKASPPTPKTRSRES